MKICFWVLVFAVFKLSKKNCRDFVTMQIRFIYEWVILCTEWEFNELNWREYVIDMKFSPKLTAQLMSERFVNDWKLSYWIQIW